MKKIYGEKFLLIITLMIICFSCNCSSIVFAGVDLPWSTTYDCGKWTQSEGGAGLDCDGLQPYGGWTTSKDSEEQITLDANNPGGGGGRGQRHWLGDGPNDNSGGLQIRFNTPQPELWVRWYMRHEEGYEWYWSSTGLRYKILYYNSGEPQQFIPDWSGWDGFLVAAGSSNYVDSGGWDTVMVNGVLAANGHRASDGAWHCFEIHSKMDTNGQNGIIQWWIDGILKMDLDDVHLGTQKGWTRFIIGSNKTETINGHDMYVDYDDLAVSNTGYIGHISGHGGEDTTPPTVSITSPTQGQIISGNAIIQVNTSDDVGVTGVQFKLDDTNLETEDTTPPYSISWDTTSTSDGAHVLTATARDAAGNQATSSPINITVGNGSSSTDNILFKESFEDINFSARGWYDNINLQLSSTEHVSESINSVEFHFNQGATTPISGGAIRKKFTETDEVYISYYVKYSSNWEGSNQFYGHHEFYLLTTGDDDWSNLAYTHLTSYIEQNDGTPVFHIQDGQNIDENNIGVNLVDITEQRSVAGCNGDSDGYGNGSCYLVGANHWNVKEWSAGSVYFQDTPGSYYKNDWHFIEVYFKLNSIQDNKGIADGILRYRYDGNLIIDHNNVMMRTGIHPDMKFNQFVIAPYMGAGSPVDQTFWVDDLTVATSRITSQLPPGATTVGFGH